MKKPGVTRCIFVDIGGVLLSDGWDRHSRERAATAFTLDRAELENRHQQAWNTHQEGKLTLDEYLGWVVFHQKRSFTRAQFRRFMFEQSKPDPEMLGLLTQIKGLNRLKVAVLSNEGRELNAYRIEKFKLGSFVDFFVSSCFVGLLKPDADIFRLALDLAQTPASEVVYIENTAMFVELAEGLGIRSILHTDHQSTRTKLMSFGLQTSEQVAREKTP
jgi:putative hydrolase of the HAD superfamily